jgi:hypothetical protein
MSAVDSIANSLVMPSSRIFTQGLLCLCISLALAVRSFGGPTIDANETATGVELGASLNIYEAVYSSNGTLTFQWYKSPAPDLPPAAISGATSQTYVVNSVTASDAGIYSVRVTDSTGPTTATVAEISVDGPEAPSVIDPPQPNTAVDGQSTSFSVTTSGSLPQTFQWYVGTQPIAGAIYETYSIPAAHISDAGTYSVLVTNSTGSVKSQSATLTVIAATPPAFTLQPSANLDEPYGNNFDLYATVSGSTPMFYQWALNGAPIAGANQNSYYIQSSTAANAGTYRLTAINAAGSATSANAVVTVALPIPVTFELQPVAQSTVQLAQTNFTLYVIPEGTSPFTFQWYKNGAPIAGATLSSLTIPIIQMSDAGAYTVAVTGTAGTVMSSAANVAVTLPGAPILQTSSGSVTRVPIGEYYNISAPNLSNDPTAITYQWSLNGQTLSGATAAQVPINSFSYSNVGEYVLRYATLGGTITSAPIDAIAQIPGYPTNSSSWTDAQSYGSTAYFLFPSSLQILRYNMSTQLWLSPVTLPMTPTAMCASADGIYVAFGTQAFLYSSDFSTRSALPNTTVQTKIIFLNGTYVYLYGTDTNDSGVFTAANRTGLALAASTSGQGVYNTQYQAISVSTSTEKAFGWESDEEPETLVAFDLNGGGSVSGFTSVTTASYTTNSRSYVSPDGTTLVAFDGNVYDTETLALKGVLAAGALDDLSFLADGKILALRGNQFSLYDPSTLALLARYNASVGGLKMFAQGTTIFAFTPPTGSSQVGVSTLDESVIAAANLTPAPALSASESQAVNTVPEDSFIDKNGLVYLMDRFDRNILVWNPLARTYDTSIPLTDYPDKFAYSSTLHRIYVTYADGRINQINLATSFAEQAFATVSSTVLNIVAVDNQLYVHLSDPYDSGDYRVLYSSTGQLTASPSGSYFSDYSYWDSATQDLYDVQFYQDLSAWPISPGTIGRAFEVYQSSTLPEYPFRFSSDGSLFATGNGTVFNASTLVSTGTLGGSFIDAAWLGSTVYGLSATGNGSAVDVWPGPTYTQSATAQVSGDPARIWALSSSKVVVLTTAAIGPIFTVLGADGSLLSQDSNSGILNIAPIFSSVSVPNENQVAGSNATFSATAFGDGDTYQWQFNGTNIPGATSSTLVLNDVQTSATGGYQLIVSNAYGDSSGAYGSLYVTAASSQVPLSISGYPTSQTALAGRAATFSVSATGGVLSYQWYFDGSAIPAATGSTLTLTDVQPFDDGNYSVTVTSVSGGQSQSQTVGAASLTVVLNGSSSDQLDFTGNGNSDVLWQNTSTGERGMYLMEGTTVTGWSDLGIVPNQWQIAGTGDFLGNGNTDILWQNTTTGECGFYMMNGLTVTGWTELGTVSTAWRIAGTGDFLGNGNIDIVWQNSVTGECGIYMMNGTTVTGWVEIGMLPLQWQIAAVGAFGGTSQPDILWHNTSTGDYGFYIMNGTAVTGWAELGAVAAPWRVGAVADYNGDGNTDILWQNTSTGQCGIYLMNGTSIAGWAELATVPPQWSVAP